MVVHVGFSSKFCIACAPNEPSLPKFFASGGYRHPRPIAQIRVGLTALKVELRDLFGGRLRLTVFGNLQEALVN